MCIRHPSVAVVPLGTYFVECWVTSCSIVWYEIWRLCDFMQDMDYLATSSKDDRDDFADNIKVWFSKNLEVRFIL